MIRTATTRTTAIAALALLVLAGQWADGNAETREQKGDPSTRSRAVTPDLLDEVAAEMNRAMQSLAVPGAPKPYLIRYKITEVEVNDVVASLGTSTSKRDRHFVNLESWVHVGDYKNDNTNLFIPRTDVDGAASIQLPVEATPRIARRATWLATDAAYKEALQQMLAKQQARRSSSNGSSSADSFSKAEPEVAEDPVLVPVLEPLDDMATRAEKISAYFRDQPHVRDSRVAFTSFIERRWYLNSEGTNATDTRRVSGVIIVANGQAADGQELSLYYSRYGQTADDLPGDDELMKEARRLAATMDELREAPIVDNYIGPVLFQGRGAADLVRHTLAAHLGGTPLPRGLPPDEAKRFGGALAGRIGSRVLSPLLNVIDDPTATHAADRALIGGYQFDDEGVAAERVQVIAAGELKTLLMGRIPSDAVSESNGHARRSAPGGSFHGSATNVLIEPTRRGATNAQLKRRLLAEIKEQKLPYGIIIRAFDDAAVTAAPELSTRELLNLLETTDRDEPPPAALAYRVYPNGREELVRGVQLKRVSMRAWRDLLAVGRKPTVHNYLASGQDNVVHKAVGVDDGAVPSAGVESAVVTPDLLFREMDISRSTTGLRPAPAVPHPAESE